MMYAPEFRHRCAIDVGKRGGNKIGLVTTALDDYDAVRGTGDAVGQIAALRALAKAAAWWISNKADKTKSDKTKTRRGVVEEILSGALSELKKLSPAEALYARKKCGAIRENNVEATVKTSKRAVKSVSFSGTAEATSLASGYSHERTAFLERGKKHPPSASAVRGVVDAVKGKTDGQTPEQKYALKKEIADWDKLKFSDFKALGDMLTSGGKKSKNLVAFLRRPDRLKYLMSYEGGEFSYISGADLSDMVERQNGIIKYGLMYAMDRYGNLYASDLKKARDAEKAGNFNHSSFCGGNEVICAGVLAINEKGILLYIDNASGHYAPDSAALKRCLKVFNDAGVGLSRVRLNVHGDEKQYIAAHFLKGEMSEWPTGWDKTLKLADVIQG